MLVRMVLHSYNEGYRSHIKRMDKKRYERLKKKIGVTENGITLKELQILEQW
jgi:hypothetical protein